MACVVMLIDGIKLDVPPDGISWERSVRAKDGDYAPIYNPYHRCRLSFGVLTGVYHDDIFALMDSELHVANLPHPSSGAMTDFDCFVDLVTGRFSTKDGKLAMAGFDMKLSGIEVTY